MSNHLKSLKIFSAFQQFKIMFGMLMRKFVSPGLSALLKTKFVVDQVLNKGGKAERKNNLICLEYKNEKSLPGKKFYIRENTSDAVIFNEILLGNGGDYQWVERIARENNIEVKAIVDAGANIGSASAFFCSVFPQAAIVSIEPEPGNFFVLEQNIKINNYQRVQPLQNAFWINNDELFIGSGVRGEREKELSYGIVQEKTGIGVRGLTFADCLRILNTEKIDLIKIDIEGAEKAIVDDKEGFSFLLDHIQMLAIELHAEVIDPFSFMDIMEKAGFNRVQYGEIFICWKTPRT